MNQKSLSLQQLQNIVDNYDIDFTDIDFVIAISCEEDYLELLHAITLGKEHSWAYNLKALMEELGA